MFLTKSKKELKKLYDAAKPEEFYRESWEQYAHSYFWLQKSQALYDASNAIRCAFWPKTRKHHDQEAAVSDFHKGPVYMLLAGLAIETLLKGILIGQNPDLVEKEKLSKKLIKKGGHNIKELYRETNFPKNEFKYDLLERLKNYVENFGRYPVTTKKYNMVNKLKTRFSSQTDFDAVDQLWNFLKKKIEPFVQIKEE